MTVLCLLSAVFSQTSCQRNQANQAKNILKTSGVKGGLVVHLNCGDGTLTEALRDNDGYLVHGLDQKKENVKKARHYIESKNQYGPVSVDHLNGSRLPYTDNLVNLIVSEDPGDISFEEIMRVLCPNGVAMIKQGDTWKKTVKPRPEEMDEWTQYLYDAGNNAVSQDKIVGPIKHFQWIGSPRWARHHDTMASMSALVSANGRMFYIFDEGPTESIQMPAKWSLIARDAFNGTILWKRPIQEWQTHIFPLKSGPAHLPRRLVAVGDRVFVTLGINAPLTELDSATGQTIRTFPETQETSEVIFSDNTLFLLIGRPERKKEDYVPRYTYVWDNPKMARNEWAWSEEKRQIMAVDAVKGGVLWVADYAVAPLTLSADSKAVYFYDGDKVVCVDRHTGKQSWESEALERQSPVSTAYAPRIVVYEDVVLFSGGKGWMTAMSAADGKTLWNARHHPSGHHSPDDLLVINGLVWSGATACTQNTGTFTGRDLHTGEVKNEFPPDVKTYWFHQRCYPSKATEKYILPSRTGIEFVDFEKQHWTIHHYVRGGCLYGIMPGNGLIYTPPHACACYIESKLNGFCALAPAFQSEPDLTNVSEENRLEKGPSYNTQIEADDSPEDWPTYRHDAERSGFTPSPVSPNVKPQWQLKLGGKLSSPVVASNRVYISKVDAHTVYAIDAATGDILWNYTAGGRVDSPPSIYKGRVLFGSADGHIYCLRASDGSLVWRYRAAPVDRRMVAFEQLESVWPVHGSVLVQNDRLYCVAGRSMFLDGGLRLLQLNPETGQKISEKVLNETDLESGKNLHDFIQHLNMPVALPDVLSSDGKYLYMRSQQFDLEGNRKHVPPRKIWDQTGEGVHLFSPLGFLDDTQFVRSYMMYGKSVASGWGSWTLAGRLVPSGRLIVVDDEKVYGYARKPEYLSETIILEYVLFAADKLSSKKAIGRVFMASRRMDAAAPHKELASNMGDWKLRKGFPLADRSALNFKWMMDQPDLQVRAMVLADKTLFVAGPPDVVDEEAASFKLDDPEVQKNLAEQNAMLEGRSGALVWAVSASDGKKLAEHKIESLPVWDGMIAVGGKLYLATMNGEVVCFSEKDN